MIYNSQYIRQKKLSRILGKELDTKLCGEGKCLFMLDLTNKNFICDDEISAFVD